MKNQQRYEPADQMVEARSAIHCKSTFAVTSKVAFSVVDKEVTHLSNMCGELLSITSITAFVVSSLPNVKINGKIEMSILTGTDQLVNLNNNYPRV